MRRAKPGPQASSRLEVAMSREIARLTGVRKGMCAEDAVESGMVVRRKVEGIWLYAPDESHIDRASDSVLAASKELCRDWLLGGMRILAGKVAKDSGLITMEAVRPLMRSHVRSGALRALPALTAEYEPHLSLFDPDDEDEIEDLVSEARVLLAEVGCVRADSLHEPRHPRTSRAWRFVVIAHLEWLGLGSGADGTFRSWAHQ
jgi:hypothetical protein